VCEWGGRGKGDRQKGSGNITTDSSNIIQDHKTVENKEHLQIQKDESALCKKLESIEFLTFLKRLVVPHSTSIQLCCVVPSC